MSTIYPPSRTISYPLGRARRRAWHRPTALALAGTTLGAMAGSRLSATLGQGAAAWAPLVPPLAALGAATAVYTLYRRRAMNWPQVRMARSLVMTAGVLMATAVGMAELRLAVVALWSMSGITVVVTALAAGAGLPDPIEEHAGPPTSLGEPWPKSNPS